VAVAVAVGALEVVAELLVGAGGCSHAGAKQHQPTIQNGTRRLRSAERLEVDTTFNIW
jgi:hypothetical protein